MSTFLWILTGGLLMPAIAMVGGVTLPLWPSVLERLMLPFVSLAAGTLLGGALFHMIPEGTRSLGPLPAAAWLAGGFVTFLGGLGIASTFLSALTFPLGGLLALAAGEPRG